MLSHPPFALDKSIDPVPEKTFQCTVNVPLRVAKIPFDVIEVPQDVTNVP